MKKVTLALLGATCGVMAMAQSINFSNYTVGEALTQAKEQKKFLLVYFYNDGCYPCEQVEGEALTKSALYSFDEKSTIAVKANLNSETYNAISSVAEITSIPSAVLMYPNGDLYSTLDGSDIRDYLNSYLSSLTSDYEYYLEKTAVEEELDAMVKQYKAGSRDKDFLMNLLNKLEAAEDNYYIYDYEFDVYEYDIIQEYLTVVSPEELLSTEKGFEFFIDNETKILSPRSEYMLKNMDAFYLKYGSEATSKIKGLLKSEIYTLGNNKDNYGLALLEKHIMTVVTSDLLKEEFAGYFKRIKKEMKKDYIDYYYWNDYYSYDYDDYDYYDY